jgi:prepilin-type N-terminal cleavage/methylation domain-containing protein
MHVSSRGIRVPSAANQDGYTLIELLVAMVLGMVIVFGCFALLEFTTSDVSRITDRTHVNQLGRTALERIMLELHSACVATKITPVLVGSSATTIKFVSETSGVNGNNEPLAELSTVKLHEIIYTAASGTTEGTLIEKSWPSYGRSTTSTNSAFLFHNTTETPTETRLLKGIKQTESTPLFRYFRFYRETDPEAKLGQIYPVPLTATQLNEAEEVKNVVKITLAFTLAPEGKESLAFGRDRAVALEDSAIMRLATSEEAAESNNFPCTQQ